MLTHTAEQDGVQHNDFIQIVQPYLSAQDDDEHDNRPAIERHQVDVAHQGFTLPTEIEADMLYLVLDLK